MAILKEELTVEKTTSVSEVENAGTMPLKTNGHGIALVPQPSDDPLDPLNWTQKKKFQTLFVVSLACLASTLQALANSSGFAPQTILYNKTLTELSYTLSASVSGLAVGPFLWIPISKCRRIGASGCIMWSLITTMAFNIWSTQLTGQDDFIPFTISRLLAAIASSGALMLGADVLVSIFFLHERGRAFGVFTSAALLGTVASGTFSGFIVEDVNWTVQYWYNIAFEGLVVILCLIWLDETGWTRDGGEIYPVIPRTPLKRKLVTYAFAGPVMPKKTFRQIVSCALAPGLVFLSPVTLIASAYLTISFGWTVAKQTMLAVYLQTPVELGGYGFSPKANAWFTFSNWLGVIVAQVYGGLLNDRLPLWICRRYGGGLWKPEYRLHTALWIPTVIALPVGLGIFGACLQYHLHYMLLAFASFLITFSGIASAPVIVNYVVENFIHIPNEAASVMNFSRVALGIVVPFFVTPWLEKVGAAWVFGMMAFFTLFADGFIIILMIWGHTLRERNLLNVDDSEEGQRVLEK